MLVEDRMKRRDVNHRYTSPRPSHNPLPPSLPPSLHPPSQKQMGALVGALSTVSQANTPAVFGTGGLLTNGAAASAASNLLNGNGLLGRGGGAAAAGGDKGVINMPTFGASVDTTTTPAGKPFAPAAGDGGNAVGAATVGAAVKSTGAPDACGAPLSISVESFTEYRVFVDGNQVGREGGW